MKNTDANKPPKTKQPAAPSTPRGSFLGRLFSHQESGLVLVIILMMAVLSVYGLFNKVPESVKIDLGPDAQVVLLDRSGDAHEIGTIAKRNIATYQVNTGDQTTTYDASTVDRYDATTNAIYQSRLKNKFFNASNLFLILKDSSFFAIMAVGMTGVIILAGIDLSVGSIYGLSAIVGAMALHALPAEASLLVALPIGLAVCIAVGTMCGFANGAMSVGLRVHPFVITLGMMAALRGLTVVLPQELFSTQSIGGFPTSFTSGFFKAQIFGVYPVPVIVMALVAIAGWFVLSRTVFGRRIFAIGGNETAARYAGIPVGRVKILVYTITGALCGLSACIYLGYLGAAETNAGNAYELQVIAATVIGGASLMGGRGTAIGAVLGAIIIQLINNAMVIFEIDQSYNQIVMGAAIIIAVVIDQTKQRVQARRG
ncbi:MAG: ABC transporter permease [Phycisphaerales bacterium]